MDNPIPFLLLGATYCVMGILWLGMVTWLAAAMAGKLSSYPKIAGRLNRISAAVYILMGVKIALSKR